MNFKTADQINEHLVFLSRNERKLTYEILQHIQLFDKISGYLKLGYSSLFEYLTRHLKYSEDSAYRRMRSARLLNSNPEVGEKIKNGKLSLTAASQLQAAITQTLKKQKLNLSSQTHCTNSIISQSLKDSRDLKESRESKDLKVPLESLTDLEIHSEKKSAVTETGIINLGDTKSEASKLEVNKITGNKLADIKLQEKILKEKVQMVLQKMENKNSFETKKILADSFELSNSTQDRAMAQSNQTVRLEIHLSAEQYQKWEQVKKLLSHLFPEQKNAEVMEYFCNSLLNKKGMTVIKERATSSHPLTQSLMGEQILNKEIKQFNKSEGLKDAENSDSATETLKTLKFQDAIGFNEVSKKQTFISIPHESKGVENENTFLENINEIEEPGFNSQMQL